jgi:flavin-dependent dehydrogenase
MMSGRAIEASAVYSAGNDRYDVIVVGAGIAGAYSAYLAARSGLRVLLAERQAFPRGKICGCCLNGRAQELLRMAGLEQLLVDLQPVRTDTLRVQRRGRCLELPVPGGVAVSRRALDERLVAAAVSAGAEFWDGVTAVVQPSDSDESQWRGVSLSRTSRQSEVFGRVVLACDGLGHPSLSRLPEYQSRPEPGARIGLGAVCERRPEDAHFRSSEIVMAVGRGGYVGVVQTESGQLNLAAAVDSRFLQRAGSPLECLSAIFAESGVVRPAGLPEAVIRGTQPLTRRSPRLTGHRLLLLGDATGYVEPFTGEGMAWALTAAWCAAPLVVQAVRSGWTGVLEQQYAHGLQAAVGGEQHICRALTRILRHSVLSAAAMTAARLCPWAVHAVVRRINRLPRLPELALETV